MERDSDNMEMSKVIAMIVGVTVSIIIFVTVLTPVILGYTTAPEGSTPEVTGTNATLITVCGTLTIIAILMLVVRNLGKGQ